MLLFQIISLIGPQRAGRFTPRFYISLWLSERIYMDLVLWVLQEDWRGWNRKQRKIMLSDIFRMLVF